MSDEEDVKVVWITNCHKCDTKNKVITGRTVTGGVGLIATQCMACEYKWGTYKEYVDDHSEFYGGLGPFPLEVQIPERLLGVDPENYISSGEFRSDLELVIADEVQKEVAQAVLEQLDRLEFDVRQVLLNHEFHTGMAKCHAAVVGALNEARKNWERVNGE